MHADGRHWQPRAEPHSLVPVKRFQIPLVPGLTSTIHVAQGAEMSPIIMLDELVTPTAVFVGITRSKRSRNCLIMK